MGGFARRMAILLLGGLLFMGCASAELRVDDSCGEVTIRGTLENVKGAPAETSGWALLLDRRLVVDGKAFSSVEVFTNRDLTPLSGKHVEATGAIANIKSVEAGQYPAFVPKDIIPKKKYLIF